MRVPFYKMNGAGNDFIIIDNREKILAAYDLSHFVKMVCRRRKSVGADGLMVLESSEKADFKMRYFNSDGSEGEMCGNGARCIAKFAYILGVSKEEMQFETLSGIHKAQIIDEDVRVNFPDLKTDEFRLHQHHDFGFGKIEYHHVTVGVPHTVIYREDVETLDDNTIRDLGRKIRYCLDLFPRGTNVNFVKVTDKNKIVIRTYERGVEDETLACGTGSIASSIVSSIIFGLEVPIVVHARGGILKVGFEKIGTDLKNIFLQGDARVVAQGHILPDALKE